MKYCISYSFKNNKIMSIPARIQLIYGITDALVTTFGPTPFFLHSDIFLNDILTKFCFVKQNLTKPKACITHSSPILT